MKNLEIAGFVECELLSSGHFCELYSAIRTLDGCEVILKIPKNSPPIKEKIASLEHEWQILLALKDSPVLPKVYGKETIDGSPAIVMEKIPYPSLKNGLPKKNGSI